jgi:hypothetical protein
MSGWKPVVALLLALALVAVLPCPAPSCSLCNNLQAPTLREEAGHSSARLILAGTLENARLAAGGSGVTDLRISDVLRKDDWLAGRKVVELPRYLAISDGKNPPQFLVFCDIFKDRLDPYRGVPLRNSESIDYVKKAMALDPIVRVGNLAFFFNYLEHPNPEVAQDAYLEFAKATDAEIGRVAPKLRPDRLREWLKNPQTPQERLSVYALLLGGCGGPAEAELLAGMLNDGTERSTAAYDGLLAGYIHLRPKEGWELAIKSLADAKRPLLVKLGVLRTLRFYHGSQPAESQARVLEAMGVLLPQRDLADIAVEDLRRWKMWELTPQVLALYGKEGYTAPIVKRAIVRYALCCGDRADAKQFIAERTKAEADLVQEVAESLEYERKK